MAGVVIDTSVLIHFLSGFPVPALEDAIAHGVAAIPPIVVAELLSVDVTVRERETIGEILQDAPIHHVDLEHWIRVGELRRTLARHGLNVTIPDAHIAQCALDRKAVLLTRDAVFNQIAKRLDLKLELL